jgi:hypothetical protein
MEKETRSGHSTKGNGCTLVVVVYGEEKQD